MVAAHASRTVPISGCRARLPRRNHVSEDTSLAAGSLKAFACSIRPPGGLKQQGGATVLHRRVAQMRQQRIRHLRGRHTASGLARPIYALDIHRRPDQGLDGLGSCREPRAAERLECRPGLLDSHTAEMHPPETIASEWDRVCEPAGFRVENGPTLSDDQRGRARRRGGIDLSRIPSVRGPQPRRRRFRVLEHVNDLVDEAHGTTQPDPPYRQRAGVPAGPADPGDLGKGIVATVGR